MLCLCSLNDEACRVSDLYCFYDMCCIFLYAVCHILLSFCIYGVCIIDIFNIQQYQQVFDL